MVFDPNNCYVCNKSDDFTKNSILNIVGYSETPIYLVLEQILGISFQKEDKKDYSICQECFINVDKFDDLQYQAEQIQNKLSSKFTNGRIEQIFIKTEKEYDEIIQQSNEVTSLRLACRKCDEHFSNVNDMMSHSHDFHSSKPSAKHTSSSRKRPMVETDENKINQQVSRSFINIAGELGFKYTFESFQNAFFSEKEKELCATKYGIQTPSTGTKRIFKKFIASPKVAKNFKQIAEVQGIEYNLQNFQKAFGFTESEKPLRPDTSRKFIPPEKISSPPPIVTRNDKKNPSVSKTFIETMNEEGVNYNLEAFQKAFGFVDAGGSGNETFTEDEQKIIDNIAENGKGNCPHCNCIFTSRYNFVHHLKNHRPTDTDLYCYECKRQFKTEDGLTIHRATDHGRIDGPLTCPHCQKSYPDRQTLRVHLYVHASNSEFLCVTCGSIFTNRKSFKMHVLSHNDSKNFLCSFQGCGKKFRTPSKLKIHERVHTGEKIYECPFCPGRRFAQKWGMDLHVNKQHKDQPRPDQTCSLCNIRVNSKAKLQRHLEKYHDVVIE